MVCRRQPAPDNNNDKLGSQDEKQPTTTTLLPSLPVPSSHCQGMITTLAKTLMRGLSTYFKGSFEFSRTIFKCQISLFLGASSAKTNFPLISGYGAFFAVCPTILYLHHSNLGCRQAVVWKNEANLSC